MGERTKIIGLLIIAQMICLASGLLIQHRFSLLSIECEARDRNWAQLENTGQALWKDFQQLKREDLSQDAAQAAHVQQLIASQPDCRTFVVDGNWQLLAGSKLPDGASLHWSDAPLSNWNPNGLPPVQEPVRGLVQLDHQEHLAVAYPLPLLGGYLVVLPKSDELHVSATAIRRPMWIVGLLSFVWVTALTGVVAYLIVSRLFERFADRRAESESAVRAHAESTARLRDAVIFGLAKLTESRDPETGYHLEKISLYCTRLAQEMRRHPRFSKIITSDFIRTIGVSAILHDIGKVGIEDSILLKPGALSQEERQRMQEHTSIGGNCIREIEHQLGSSNFLQMAREIALSHHEWWNGSGYPCGLAGEEIPLAARIVSVVDVYEALSSKRVYKAAMPHEQCVELIKQQSGKQFDPDIVECFLRIERQFQLTARHFLKMHEAEEAGALQAAPAPDESESDSESREFSCATC